MSNRGGWGILDSFFWFWQGLGVPGVFVVAIGGRVGFVSGLKRSYRRMSETKTDIILALDVADRAAAEVVLDRVAGHLNWVKIGLQLFTREGPSVVEAVAGRGFKVFLDLKLHDIPNTVASAVQSLASLPVELLTLHAAGGGEMLRAAVEARNSSGAVMRLLAVTVLTSMDDAGLAEIGMAGPAASAVERLAGVALGAGVDGLVCSPLELEILRPKFGAKPLLVTPGVRPASSSRDEQKRVMTPAAAAAAGASFLVIGRPILQAADVAAAVAGIWAEIENGRG